MPEDDAGNKWPHDRLSQRRLEGLSDGIPEVGPGRYLVEALFEVGPVSPGFNGPLPITWQEIAGYMAATEAISEPWEARLLVAMSREFIAGLEEGRNVLSIPPAERNEDR